MPVPISSAAEAVGNRVKARRREMKATQDELAQASGVDSTTIRKIELGTRNVNMHNLIRIAHCLKMDPGLLLEGLTIDMVPEVAVRVSPAEKFAKLRDGVQWIGRS